MRIAFTAAAAQIQCRVQRRRRRRRREIALHPRVCLRVLASIFDTNPQRERHNPRTRETCRECRVHQASIFASIFPNKDSFHRFKLKRRSTSPSPKKATVGASTPHRRNQRPLLTFWHVTSLILFLVATTFAFDASSSTSKMTDDDRTLRTPSSESNLYSVEDGVRSRVGIASEDADDEDDGAGSCHRYDYFLSPQRPLDSSSSDSVSLVRRSVDGRSPAHAAPSSAVDNVFAIWLRASRYDKPLDDHLDDDEDDDGDGETSWPLQRPRTRHRYQHYRSAQSSRTSTKKQSPSTPRPRPSSTPWIRAVIAPQRPRATSKKPIVRAHSKASSKFPQCKIFDEVSANELCGLDVSKRVDALRHVYIPISLASRLPSNDSNTNSNSSTFNITLYELFSLDVNSDSQKSRPKVNHLSDSLRPCVISGSSKNSTNVSSCQRCYKNLLARLKNIDSQHEAFSRSVLSMIDCEPDNDLEQFSPAHNCSGCKLWYKRWLLVIFSDIWKQKPCLQWCHLAELACPHLMPVRRNDYAGLPSFRCTDPEILSLSAASSTYGPSCDCIHPCDLTAYSNWGWRISSEIPEFCRDYRKQDTIDCPNKISLSTRSWRSNASRNRFSAMFSLWILGAVRFWIGCVW